MKGHSSDVFVCAWNPRTNVLATGSGDATARIWTIPGAIPPKQGETWVQPIVLWHDPDSGADRSNAVNNLDWSSDGTKLATGHCDGIARIWSESGEQLQDLILHKGPLFSLKWSKNGEYLLSSGMDKTAVIWKASTGELGEARVFCQSLDFFGAVSHLTTSTLTDNCARPPLEAVLISHQRGARRGLA